MRKIVLALSLLLATGAAARAADRYFTTSDGVRLHYIEAGPESAPTLVFVPGWTMPAWIFQPQIAYFARSFHVVALDPRGQGESETPPGGYNQDRRGEDIADLIAVLRRKVVLAGWSLGVLDSLAYVHMHGDGRLLGLVLIDNSVGEGPAPRPGRHPPRRGPGEPRDVAMAHFVRGMFHTAQPPEFLDTLTAWALRTPPDAAAALLAYPVPRTYWREAVYSVRVPILYIVTPRLAEQASDLQAGRPDAVTDVFYDAGHALFIDDAARFNAELLSFLQQRVHP